MGKLKEEDVEVFQEEETEGKGKTFRKFSI